MWWLIRGRVQLGRPEVTVFLALVHVSANPVFLVEPSRGPTIVQTRTAPTHLRRGGGFRQITPRGLLDDGRGGPEVSTLASYPPKRPSFGPSLCPLPKSERD